MSEAAASTSGIVLEGDWWEGSEFRGELYLPGQSTLAPEAKQILESIATDSHEGRLDIPPMPKVAMDAVKLLRSDDIEIEELGACIELDPAISAQVLRHANSVLYGARFPIDTINRAIGHVGLKKIKSILLEVAVKSVGGDAGAPAYAQMEWSYALHSAAISRSLAKRLGLNDEMCYLAGLLHDIGRVPVLRALARRNALSAPRADAPAEIILEALHRGVGSQVAVAWELPPAVADAVGSHLIGRLPDEPSQTEFPSTRVTEIAGNICLALGLGRFKTPFDIFGTAAVGELGMSRADLVAFLQEDLPDVIERVASVL